MTLTRTAYEAARLVAHVAWGDAWETFGHYAPETKKQHARVVYWQSRINALNGHGPTLALTATCQNAPLDAIAAALGLSSSCRQKLRTAGAGGLNLYTVRDKVRKLKQSGAIKGAGGVYITHERNRRGDKVYHRLRLNICAGGRRVRRDLGSYRVR